METKDIKIGVGLTMALQAHGTGFRFESGASTTTDKYIKVTPENGPSVLVKPGQQFQLSNSVGNWTLAANDAAAVLTGRVVIFNKGENFADSNVNNTFTLDASLANNVTVMNDAAHRVPVTLDTTQVLNTVAGAMTYSSSFSSAADASVAPIQIVSAAANVNGVVIKQIDFAGTVPGGTNLIASILAKATAPAHIRDGDVIDMAAWIAAGVASYKNNLAVKVAAGKGVYVMTSIAESVSKSVLFDVL